MPKITITSAPYSGAVPFAVNGKRLEIPQNKPVDVPAEFLPVLESAVDIEFEVDGSVDLDILDGTVEDVSGRLEGLSPEQAKSLLAAEEAGKTRKGVIAAISKFLKGE